MSTKGPPFSYRMQSRERQSVASKVHRQTVAWIILTEEKLLLTCKVKGFCLHCPAFKFYQKADDYLKQWQRQKGDYSYFCLHDRAVSLHHVHYYSSLLHTPEISGTSLCQQLQDIGRNPGSWYQKELNLRLHPGQLEKCKRQQTELHALNQLFQT